MPTNRTLLVNLKQTPESMSCERQRSKQTPVALPRFSGWLRRDGLAHRRMERKAKGMERTMPRLADPAHGGEAPRSGRTVFHRLLMIELFLSLKGFVVKSYTNQTRILVVDDNEIVREVTKGMLSLLGYNVTTVPSGEAALEYLKMNSVDLVILDMVLGKGMDGLDVYLRILELYENQKTIIISGSSDPERVKQARLLGAKYVEKPFDIKTIGAVVREQLGGSLLQ